MFRAIIAVLVVTLLALPAVATNQQQQAAAAKALCANQLQLVAELVREKSAGKASLLAKKGLAANPRAGYWARPVPSVGPVVTAYITSAPVSTYLPDIGDGRILGAVTLTTGAGPATVTRDGKSAAEGTGSAVPGTYVLFQPEGKDQVVLGSPVRVMTHYVGAKPGVLVKEVVRVPLFRMPYEARQGQRVSAWFPDKKHVSDQQPAWQVNVCLYFQGEALQFRLAVTGLEFV